MHIHECSEKLRASLEMHDGVVAQAPGEKPFGVVVYFLRQDLLHRARVPAAHLGGDGLHLLQKPVEAPLHHVLRNLVLHGRRRRPGPSGIDESERAVVPHLSHHVHGLLEVLFGLPGEAHDDVRGQRNIGNGCLYLIHQRKILLLRIPAVHLL